MLGVVGRRQVVAAVGVAATLSVAGCSDSGGSTTPTPSTSASSTSPRTATITGPPSPTVSTSAAEAVRAALLAYQRTVDSIYRAGGQDPNNQLETVATGEQLAFLLRDLSRLKKNNWHLVGSTQIQKFNLVGISSGRQPRAIVDFCLNASKTDGVDTRGKSIRKAGSYKFFESTSVLVMNSTDQSWKVTHQTDKPVKSC